MEGRAAGDGLKGAHTVGEVAAVFPEKMTDEGLGRLGIARGLEKKVFKFAAQPAQIEDAVGPFQALEIDGHGVAAAAEQKVRRRGVAVNQHGPVLPQAAFGRGGRFCHGKWRF